MADVTAPFGFPYPENTDLVRDGAQDIENLATGVNDQLALGFQYVGTRYYTSSGRSRRLTRSVTRRSMGRRCGLSGSGSSAVVAAAARLRRAARKTLLAVSGSGATYAEKFITDIAGVDDDSDRYSRCRRCRRFRWSERWQ
jgi:hypothetical protein